ncbi:hypothetical protein GCM10007047_15190 [Cerasicoccus arenae]|uniref:Uncharacterized protein n=2 Tax=Cerasicoccus arenae TaxID=424488 RepID=A0A8J3D9W3_9BACT|nr:hypothetical protein GCM10007047_15190 [Cerasicoccus arenae]
MMGFIILLILSLSTLVRVELQSATHSTQDQQARQMALLALQVSLGELQRYLGPDQRVTANADITDSELPRNKRFYTGVYDSTTGELLTYLASGLTVEEGGTPAAQRLVSFTPNISTDGSAVDPDAQVVLVGPNTLSVEDGEAANYQDDYVSVGLMDVEGIGSFGYWVGDENLKVRVNLPSGVDEEITSNADPRYQYSLNAPRGVDASVITGFEGFVSDDARLRDLSDFSLYQDGAFREQAGKAFHDITFHSAGVQSNTRDGGLKKDLSLAFEMTDAKFQSNADFTGKYPAPYVNHRVNYVFLEDVGRGANYGIRGPTWDLLRNHYRLYKEVEKVGDGYQLASRIEGPRQPAASHSYEHNIPHQWNMQYNIEPDDPSVRDYAISSGNLVIRPTSEAIHPLVASIRYQYSARLRPITTDYRFKMAQLFGLDINKQGTPSEFDTHYVELIWDPVITLWNPYNVMLTFTGYKLRTREIPTTFEFRIGEARPLRPYDVGIRPEVRNDWRIYDPENWYLGNGNYDIKFGDMIGGRDKSNNGFVENGLSVVIGQPNQTITLEPGELKVYSIVENSAVSLYDYLEISGDNPNAVFFTAKEGWEDRSGFYVFSPVTGRVEPLKDELDNTIAEVQSVQFRVRSRWEQPGMEYYLQGYLFDDYNSAAAAKLSPDEDPNQLQMFELSGVDQWKEEWVDYPDNFTDVLPFDSPIWNSDKVQVGNMNYYMKPANEIRRPVALAQYNNPRARTNARLPNQDYESVDPLWIWDHREAQLGVFIDAQNHGFWGSSMEGGDTHVVLYETPTVPMTSIGSMMHVNASIRGHYPLYAMGDSFAPPFLASNAALYQTFENDRNDTDIYYWDQSYLMNQALWDGYFFSTISPKTTDAFDDKQNLGEVLSDFEDGKGFLANERFVEVSNGSLTLSEAVLNGGNTVDDIVLESPGFSAGHLLLSGAFNVNSTSPNAWKALLAALRDEAVSYLDAQTGNRQLDSEQGSVFSRSSLPSGDSHALWRGFVRLSDVELEALAMEIVNQVRARGPFMSLSDFVNRQVKSKTGNTLPADDPLSLSGALQTAIDASEINENSERESSTDYFQNQDAAEGNTFNGAPGILLQSDLLAGLGPVISVRSDTFRIRTYGRVDNSLTGGIVSEAYLEAIVQRSPEPVVRAANDATMADYYEPDLADAFGRRFKIVHFRWLNKSEI